MKDLLRLTVPIALIAAVSPGLADAQPVTRTFVKGTVTSAGKPARSVWVIISLSGREKGRSLTGDDLADTGSTRSPARLLLNHRHKTSRMLAIATFAFQATEARLRPAMPQAWR